MGDCLFDDVFQGHSESMHLRWINPQKNDYISTNKTIVKSDMEFRKASSGSSIYLYHIHLYIFDHIQIVFISS